MPNNINNTKSVAKSLTKSITSKKLTTSYNSIAIGTREDSRLF